MFFMKYTLYTDEFTNESDDKKTLKALQYSH